jgi:4-hydroxy-tetrahydrodipicolinate reductase
MVKIIVTGAAGRMGGRIITLASADSDVQVVAALERKGHSLQGKDVGEHLGLDGHCD